MHRSKTRPSSIEDLRSSEAGEAASIWFALVWPLTIFSCWLLGLLLLHPWAGFFIGLVLGLFARDYAAGKNLWSFLGLVIWTVGVLMNHAWFGFVAGLGVVLAGEFLRRKAGHFKHSLKPPGISSIQPPSHQT